MDKQLPLVSIIVPAFNTGAYMGECLQSLSTQSYHAIEIIVVDDGSTDDTATIADDYMGRDRRFKVIHQQNHGLSNARNVGLSASSGSFIMFCDSDDTVDPEWVKTLVDQIQADNSDVVFHTMGDYGNDGSIRYLEHKQIVDLIPDATLDRAYNKIFRADFLRNNNVRFDENMKYGEDAKFVMAVLSVTEKPITVICKNLYRYRIVSGSISHRKYIPGLWNYKRQIYDAREEYFLQKGLLNVYKSVSYNTLKLNSIIHALFNVLSPCNPMNTVEQIDACREIFSSMHFREAIRFGKKPVDIGSVIWLLLKTQSPELFYWIVRICRAIKR